MSDTPRTDAAYARWNEHESISDAVQDIVDISMELECELKAEREQYDRLLKLALLVAYEYCDRDTLSMENLRDELEKRI